MTCKKHKQNDYRAINDKATMQWRNYALEEFDFQTYYCLIFFVKAIDH